MSSRLFLVTGRPGSSPDGIVDYCDRLQAALEQADIPVGRMPVGWAEQGWFPALRLIAARRRDWKGKWVAIQYTALSWSRRGFPLGLLLVMRAFRLTRCRIALVLHDASAYRGTRLRDRWRRRVQMYVMRRAVERSDLVVTTIPAPNVEWLPAGIKTVYIPTGSNAEPVGGLHHPADRKPAATRKPRKIAVFGFTGSEIKAEAEDLVRICDAVAKGIGKFELHVVGRGSAEAATLLASLLPDDVSLENHGVVDDSSLREIIASVDLLLFIRGELSSRRTTAIAAVAAGTPVAGYEGPETAPPLTEAGVVAVAKGEIGELADAAIGILSKPAKWQKLSRQSSAAYRDHFSWRAIADSWRDALDLGENRINVLIMSTHPVQYASAIFRSYYSHPALNSLVAYCSMQGSEEGRDPEFGVDFAWDVPLLDGHEWVNPPNAARRPSLDRAFGLVNPGLWRLIRSSNFDVVVCYGYRQVSFWIAIAAAKMSRSALVLSTDAHDLQSRQGSLLKRLVKGPLLRVVYRLADGSLAPSTRSRKFLAELGVRRPYLTPYVVDNAFFASKSAKSGKLGLRVDLGWPKKSVVALFMGKLVAWKRPGDVLEAAARVDGLRVLMAGDGPLRAELEHRASMPDLNGRVEFLGFVNQSEAPRIYASSDVLVLPSSYEPFGVVVNEAFACGVPAVVSDACGASDDLVADEETGFVFHTGDVEDLAHLLSRFVAESGLAAKLGTGARQRISQWDVDANTDAFVAACRDFSGSPDDPGDKELSTVR
ncbi:MAG TPA: glycosyltransferase [Actinomycetota bacterium]|nr:glycosyltransferase [Actinomycetota bacterium]